MRDLFAGAETQHEGIYRSLRQIRETFHREGRISDSNAKLDETVKFIMVHFGYSKGLVSTDDYKKLCARQSFTVNLLNDVFTTMANNAVFYRTGIGSIFGETPTTVFREGDESIAFDLFTIAGRAFTVQSSEGNSIDVLNEAFGHHVRDNFRNHIEDAQYMTPIEVVDFMVDMAIHKISSCCRDTRENFTVVDPSCGVGSFLTRWRIAWRKAFHDDGRNKLQCLGQDKVERMVRLTAVNFLLSGSGHDDVYLGNSIEDSSPIGKYNGSIDLILTNPPFGARFPVDNLRKASSKSTPFFAKCSSVSKAVNSEILFLDRYLTMLKPGGVCLAIVPDGVISAKGASALVRQHLTRNAEILGIVELPPVAFAQAGTRTKTAILAFQKNASPKRTYPVFFAEASDLGFQVSKRKGVPIRKKKGVNQLPDVFQSFILPANENAGMIETPVRASWSRVAPSELGAWTPRVMLFDVKSLGHRVPYELLPVKEFVVSPRRRRAQAYTEKHYFISVLHVVGEGVLDLSGIRRYQPITPGLPVEPGEVLVSRINPRIPRVTVVPNLERKMLCSSEFEVLAPNPGVSPYLLAFLLLCPMVQEQIQAFTAGTSASHSRIKPGKIYDVLLPNLGDVKVEEVESKIRAYEKACISILSSLVEMERVRNAIEF